MVLVDDREPSEIRDGLHKRISVKVCRLSVGDYIIGDFAIERKNVGDLFDSLVDGRFWNQLLDLSRAYNKAYLLVEGNISSLYKVYGAMNYAVFKYGVSVLYSRDAQHTASILYSIYTVLGKPVPRQVSREPKRQPAQLAVLCQFPLIGQKTAHILLREFGSLKKIFNASPNDLKKVLGRKRRALFRGTLTNNFSRVSSVGANSRKVPEMLK